MHVYNEDIVHKSSSLKYYLLILLLLGGAGVGLYFLIEALQDPQTQELSKLSSVLSNWSADYPVFLNTSISLRSGDSQPTPLQQNFSDGYAGAIKSFPVYPYLSYTVSAQLWNNDVKNVSAGKQFNITTSLVLTITNNDTVVTSTLENVPIHSRKYVPANGKVCRIEAKGYWDPVSQACYYQYNTVEICVVVDSNLSVVSNYASGCDNLGYYRQSEITWTSDIVFNQTEFFTFVQVRSLEDPFVFASHNQMVQFSPSSKEFLAIGATIFTLCSVIAIVPCAFLCSGRSKRKYLQMEAATGKNIV